MSKRTHLIGLIERYIKSSEHLPPEIQRRLEEAKETLKMLSDEQYEKISDHVFASTADEREFKENHPHEILYSIYDELERTARKEQNPELEEVVKELQLFYGITEKDGYFP